MYGHKPYTVKPHILDIIKFCSDAVKVAYTVIIAVIIAVDKYLVPVSIIVVYDVELRGVVVIILAVTAAGGNTKKQAQHQQQRKNFDFQNRVPPLLSLDSTARYALYVVLLQPHKQRSNGGCNHNGSSAEGGKVLLYHFPFKPLIHTE